MVKRNFGEAGTITATGATGEVGPTESVLIVLDAGSAIVDVEIQPPSSNSWVKAEVGIDASVDVVKVFEAPACKVRLNCTAYTSDTPFWLIAR